MLLLPDHHYGKNLVFSNLPQTAVFHPLRGGICFGEVGSSGVRRVREWGPDRPHTTRPTHCCVVFVTASPHQSKTVFADWTTPPPHLPRSSSTFPPAKSSPPRRLLSTTCRRISSSVGKGRPLVLILGRSVGSSSGLFPLSS